MPEYNSQSECDRKRPLLLDAHRLGLKSATFWAFPPLIAKAKQLLGNDTSLTWPRLERIAAELGVELEHKPPRRRSKRQPGKVGQEAKAGKPAAEPAAEANSGSAAPPINSKQDEEMLPLFRKRP